MDYFGLGLFYNKGSPLSSRRFDVADAVGEQFH